MLVIVEIRVQFNTKMTDWNFQIKMVITWYGCQSIVKDRQCLFEWHILFIVYSFKGTQESN